MWLSEARSDRVKACPYPGPAATACPRSREESSPLYHMCREPFSHRTKIVRVNLAAPFSHVHPHLMVVIGKLTNREIVVGAFSQDSLKYGHTLLHWYQLVPVAEQKQCRHSQRPQCRRRIVIHLL